MNDLTLEVDSIKLREYASEILKLVDDYNTLIYTLYNELSNISNNEIWVGTGANKFILSLPRDKESCMKLGKMLYDYANTLNYFADSIEVCVKGCEFND